jgi:dTDP-4-dehydrorhamnose reductase
LGKGGQVGWELQRSLAPWVSSWPWTVGVTRTGCAATSPTWTAGRDRACAVRPNVIVNAAAHTAVDKAESEPDLARHLNTDWPRRAGRRAQALGAWLVHYSTDYVFDGSGHSPWVEDRPHRP